MHRSSFRAFAVALCLTAAAPAAAQGLSDGEAAALGQRLDAAEMQVAQLATSLGRPDLADLANPAIVPVQQTYAAELEVRVTQLEARLQQLTGLVEQLQHSVDQSRDRLDRALNDIEFRLVELEGGDPYATTGGATTGGELPQPAVPGGAGGQPINVIDGQSGALTGGQSGLDGNVRVDPSTGVLGTLQLTPGSGGASAIGQTAALPNDPALATYNNAFALLQRADYDGAEVALANFLAQYPSHPLASNAHYWLGETYYVRGRFEEAAGAYARGYSAFPGGASAVDSLLKLGMSLAQLGQRTDACLTFDQLNREFPNAALAIQRRAEQERLRLACP
ncbi:MAG: tol-pal system protein YbgF [Rhodospirillaceae bacterium]|nr:tol-pal system protein YbgF [Rhodospirillaceae bacterium]